MRQASRTRGWRARLAPPALWPQLWRLAPSWRAVSWPQPLAGAFLAAALAGAFLVAAFLVASLAGGDSTGVPVAGSGFTSMGITVALPSVPLRSGGSTASASEGPPRPSMARIDPNVPPQSTFLTIASTRETCPLVRSVRFGTTELSSPSSSSPSSRSRQSRQWRWGWHHPIVVPPSVWPEIRSSAVSAPAGRCSPRFSPAVWRR